MKLCPPRSILALSLTALLTACGGADLPVDATSWTAAQVGSGAPATAAVKVAAGPMPVTSGQPAPDCQPENCAGLRIIDGNAEAWRVDSQRNVPNS
jgi:hypothetical protein